MQIKSYDGGSFKGEKKPNETSTRRFMMNHWMDWIFVICDAAYIKEYNQSTGKKNNDCAK